MPDVDVLVVDDDRDLLETVTEILDMEGYSVATATNGVEALDYLRANHSPRVILLDLSMPIMDGLTFRSEQRKDAALAEIPVVAFSAAAQLAEKVRGHDFAAVLKKPVKLDVILGTVARFCPR
jgi:two-component system, chemotaxis family, chemotaxis protein CheY